MIDELGSPQAPPAAPARHVPCAAPSWARVLGVSCLILLPFLAAAGIWIFVRVERTAAAVSDLELLADNVTERLLASGSEHPDLGALARTMADEVYGERGAQGPSRGRLEHLVRAIAYRISSSLEYQDASARLTNPSDRTAREAAAHTFVAHFYGDLKSQLWTDSAVLVGLQALLVLMFPTFYVIAVARAARELRATEGERFDHFAEQVRYGRRCRLLAEQARPYFWRRFGFGLLIGLAATYVLAPLGLKVAVIGEFVNLFAPPGGTSHPLPLDQYAHAPHFVIGFAGFYLYALTVFAQRFFSRDLNQRLLVSLFNRGATVGILSLALAAIAPSDGFSRALIFVVGIFPQVGLQWIARTTQSRADALLPDRTTQFAGVPEIDLVKGTSLAEVGITNLHDLATADLAELMEEVGIDPRLLLGAVDRAILVHALGIERASRLAAVPLATASALLLYVRGREAFAERWRRAGLDPALAPAALGRRSAAEAARRKKVVEAALEAEDVTPLVDQLAADPNVAFIVDNEIWYGSARRAP
jgi:hypothetical protein